MPIIVGPGTQTNRGPIFATDHLNPMAICWKNVTHLAERPGQPFWAGRAVATGQAEGWLFLCDIWPANGNIEIGSIWFAPGLQRTRAATEAVFLLMRYALDELGYQRLVWRCVVENQALLVVGSAVAMDKDLTKRLLRDAGLSTTRFCVFTDPERPSFDSVVEHLGRPVFVKPARLGSSVGVGKAGSVAEFDIAVGEAFRHDVKILVEAYAAGREVECGVLENEDGSLLVSVPDEIVPTNQQPLYL